MSGEEYFSHLDWLYF